MTTRTIMMSALMAISLGGLAGCAGSGYDLSTPEGVAQYQRDLAITQQGYAQSSQTLAQTTAMMQNQADSYQAPVIGSYQQPETTVVYCNQLTGQIYNCRWK